jgi:endonuclease/exonuclease/phosphatase family metal-dependent hydrolase
MKFTVLNWNIGGAKVLEQRTRSERKETCAKINKALSTVLKDPAVGRQPDVVTLQEIVQWKEPTDDCINDLLEEIEGYSYFPFTLIDSKILSSKAKWNKVIGGNEKEPPSDWHPDTYFAQGNAFLIKKSAPHYPVWDLSKIDHPKPPGDHFIELVHLDSGIYFGDRNTEPRAALVAHFIYDPRGKEADRNPLDIFVVNVHLTTLMMEREGVPEIDAMASRMRVGQLDVIFNGIVSRYNSWRQSGYRERGDPRKEKTHETFKRHSPVWIIAGDFNFTEESAEYAYVKRMNFLDTVPESGKKSAFGHGTKAKGVGKPPTLTLDYIFAGPRFVSLDPAIDLELKLNQVIHEEEVRASDHYPVLSTMALIPS